MRLNVARALMSRSDLLLLDEPTNHLDLDAVLWLEHWLQDYRGTLLLIAHDRDFLDDICNRIVNIEHGKIEVYRGNYSDFEEARAVRLAQDQALYLRQQREVKHIESFINRFKAQASKAGKHKAASRRSNACSALHRRTWIRNLPFRSWNYTTCHVRCLRSMTRPRAMTKSHWLEG